MSSGRERIVGIMSTMYTCEECDVSWKNRNHKLNYKLYVLHMKQVHKQDISNIIADEPSIGTYSIKGKDLGKLASETYSQILYGGIYCENINGKDWQKK